MLYIFHHLSSATFQFMNVFATLYTAGDSHILLVLSAGMFIIPNSFESLSMQIICPLTSYVLIPSIVTICPLLKR